MKDGNGRLTLIDDELQMIWRDYYEGLHHIFKKSLQSICVASILFRGNYFGKTEVGMIVRKVVCR